MPAVIDGETILDLPAGFAGDPSVMGDGGAGSGPRGAAGGFRAAIAAWHDRGDRDLLAGAVRRRFDPSSLGAPVPRPGQIIGAPVNYRDHQREMSAEHTIAGLGFFMKSPSSVIGPDGSVPIPLAGRRTDQEAELGVVMGRTATDVSAAEALDYVFGYTCLVDVTVRGAEERSTRKSFPGFTPIGPWIVTADEVGDPSDLTIRGWVNDELRQEATTADMVYPVDELIEFISSVVTLEPGDVIATGTPAGVGPIVPGDTIRVGIESIGELVVGVVEATRSPHGLWLARNEA